MTNIAERNINTGRGVNIRNLHANPVGQNNDTGRDLDLDINHVVDTPFDLIERQKGEFTIFAPKGPLNNATRKFFKKVLYNAADEVGCKIIINLRFVDSIDSVGLGILITAHKKANENGGMVVFTDMSERISKNMKMLYMDRYLNIRPDMKSAVEMMDW